ncbi:MAG: hypothetical protein ACSHWS_17125 [Sulfitobacter sp.]
MPHSDAEISRLEQANLLGLTYLRTVVLLNGGAMIAVLTLVGNSTEKTAILFSLMSVKCSMVAFVLGIASILSALLVSYVFTANAPESKTSNFLNNYVVGINAFLGLLSLASFLAGSLILISGAS